MEKKQTRRSVSISGELYDELQDYCRTHGMTKSGLAEALLRKQVGMKPRDKDPEPDKVSEPGAKPKVEPLFSEEEKKRIEQEARQQKAQRLDLIRERASRVFTF